MDILYFFAARFAEQTSTGAMNVIGGGIDLIRADQMPLEFPSLFAVGKIRLDREEARTPHRLKVRLLDPSREVFAETDVNQSPGMELPPDRTTMNIGFSLGILGLVFLEEGIYHLQLLFDGEEVKSVRLRVGRDLGMQPAPASSGVAATLPEGQTDD